jgi:hypothetical protein
MLESRMFIGFRQIFTVHRSGVSATGSIAVSSLKKFKTIQHRATGLTPFLFTCG